MARWFWGDMPAGTNWTPFPPEICSTLTAAAQAFKTGAGQPVVRVRDSLVVDVSKNVQYRSEDPSKVWAVTCIAAPASPGAPASTSSTSSPAPGSHGSVGPGQAAAALPEGWAAAVDARGRTYYINVVSRTSQWHRPTTPAMDAETTLKMLELRKVEEELLRKKAQLDQERIMLDKRDKELKVIQKMDEMVNAEPDWKLKYSEIEFDQTEEARLGETVCRASWRGTEVAVKSLLPEGQALDAEDAERFAKDAAVMRSLHHPNLVLFLGACLEPRVCLVTELMPAGSLHDLLHRKKHAPSAQKRATYAADMARAMVYLHSLKPPVVHGNFKSQNVLLDEKGEHCKVCEAGCPRIKNLPQHADDATAWLAPEQITGQPCSEKVDVYAFGMVLYEMLSGKQPFAGLSAAEIQVKVGVYEKRPSIPSSCPLHWRELVSHCWNSPDTSRPSFVEIMDTLPSID
eukprot:m51a1_g11410 putative flag-tagged protein kinase domain of mitogen-activated protein kinase kinase kinase (458) ;mRNA; f:15611-17421